VGVLLCLAAAAHSDLTLLLPVLLPVTQVLGVSVAAGSIVSAVHESQERILANCLFCGLAILLCRAIYLDSDTSGTADGSGTPAKGKQSGTSAPGKTKKKHDDVNESRGCCCCSTGFVPGVLIGGAVFYAFIMPMLGAQVCHCRCL
jgi:hypothetical protein